MADPSQVAGAVIGLIESTFKAAKLLQNLSRARDDARELYENTAQLHSLALTVRDVLEDRKQQGQLDVSFSENPIVERTLISIARSIESCKRAVSKINGEVQSLAEDTQRAWVKRARYLWSADVIRNQEKFIVLHLHFLAVNLQLLQNFGGSGNQEMTRSTLAYSNRLQAHAENEESAVADMLEKCNASTFAAGEPHDTEHSSSTSGRYEHGQLDEDDEKHDILSRTCPEYLLADAAPLAVALRRGDMDAESELRTSGFYMSFRDKNDWTFIHHASYWLDKAFLSNLLSDLTRFPSDFIDVPAKRGDTALMLVAQQADDKYSYDIAKLLLENGCKVSAVNEGEPDRDALYYAVQRSTSDEEYQDYVKSFIDLLLDHEADTTLLQKVDPQKARRFPRMSSGPNEQAVEDGDATSEQVRSSNKRKESKLDKFKRTFSIGHSDSSARPSEEIKV